jgi:rhamnose utilization protein RhaD (predicted bifunctional aldolase and dehydrogenase)
MHPVAVIAIATAKDGPALTKEVYGDDVIWTNWLRPGFELGLELERVAREHPNAKGAIMGQHGLINWANGDKECYELTLDLIRRAQEFLDARAGAATSVAPSAVAAHCRAERVLVELLPWLRGKVSEEKRQIATVEMRDEVLEFVNSNDAPRLAELGTSCPDHFLRTKIKPLYADWNPSGGDVASLKKVLEAGLTQYRSRLRVVLRPVQAQRLARDSRVVAERDPHARRRPRSRSGSRSRRVA